MGQSKQTKEPSSQSPQKSSLLITCYELPTVFESIRNANKTSISSLSLRKCRIGSKGAKLLTNGDWSVLQNLNLTENRLGKYGCLHLAKLKSRNLKSLNLLGNSLRDEDCRSLPKGHWPKLVFLTLNENRSRWQQERRVNQIHHWGALWAQMTRVEKRAEIKPTKEYQYHYVPEDDFDLF